MQSAIDELEKKARAAKEASRKLAHLPSEVKNGALVAIAESLVKREKEILECSQADCNEARASGMGQALLDRLVLSAERISGMAQDVRTIASLPDPVGESFDARTLPNGLRIERRLVPLGVIGAIYESRPNVTVDMASLCLKSGNAVILRGGKEAAHSNWILAKVIKEALAEAGVPDDAVQLIESTERALVKHMLEMKDIIDLIIPRGGEQLVAMVTGNAAMPVLAAGAGVCHTYVDSSADLEKAAAIAFNAKVQRPTVCNALDALLVHTDVAERYLPMIAADWARAGVEMHCDERSLKVLSPISNLKLAPASDGDWGKEFLALVAAVKVVDSLDEALEHIARYSSGHSEAIITEDYSAAMRFLEEVDAACVYVNASTRFTDGGQFGLGAEVAISTQKFHARGPMGLKELTTYKWVIMGSGQVRP